MIRGTKGLKILYFSLGCHENSLPNQLAESLDGEKAIVKDQSLLNSKGFQGHNFNTLSHTKESSNCFILFSCFCFMSKMFLFSLPFFFLS